MTQRTLERIVAVLTRRQRSPSRVALHLLRCPRFNPCCGIVWKSVFTIAEVAPNGLSAALLRKILDFSPAPLRRLLSDNRATFRIQTSGSGRSTLAPLCGSGWVLALVFWRWRTVFDSAYGNFHENLGQLARIAGALGRSRHSALYSLSARPSFFACSRTAGPCSTTFRLAPHSPTKANAAPTDSAITM